MLRGSVIAVCAVLVVLALVQLMLGHPYGWLPIGIEAGVIALLIVVERGRYKAAPSTSQGLWTSTGERFADPASGQTIEVFSNGLTGEREYRPAG